MPPSDMSSTTTQSFVDGVPRGRLATQPSSLSLPRAAAYRGGVIPPKLRSRCHHPLLQGSVLAIHTIVRANHSYLFPDTLSFKEQLEASTRWPE